MEDNKMIPFSSVTKSIISPKIDIDFPNSCLVNIPSYISSVRLTRKPCILPSWDISVIGAQAVSCYKEPNEVSAKATLKKTRKKMVVFRREIEEKWKKIKEKQLVFKNSITKHNDLVADNQDKVYRSDKQMEVETVEQIRQKERRDESKKVYKYYVDRVKDYKEQIESYEIYKTFLEKVVELSHRVSTVEEALLFYHSLEQCQHDIYDQIKASQIELNRLKDNAIELIHEKQEAHLALLNELKELNLRYDLAKAKKIYWGHILNDADAIIREKTSQIYHIQQFTWNLYCNCCVHMGEEPTVDNKDIEQHMEYVKKYIEYKKLILEKAKALMETDDKYKKYLQQINSIRRSTISSSLSKSHSGLISVGSSKTISFL